MEPTLIEKIIEAYMNGMEIDAIAEGCQLAPGDVLDRLRHHKEQSIHKRTFSDAFKRMIAERDLSGVARASIAKELGLNISTVKKSCELFGQNYKERAVSENMYTRIEGNAANDRCVKCESRHYNEVEEHTYFCFTCGAEAIHGDGYVLLVNWEYVD